MKNLLIGLCTFLFLFLGNTEELKSQNKSAFFVELLGNGLFFSANYDMRFTDNINGIGGRLGIGYVGGGDASVVTVPAMVNYLLGKDGKYFEIGAGVTYVSASADFIGDDTSDSNVWGTLSFMYRQQPVDGGFMWKIGITPIIAEGIFVPYWMGVGIGYCW